MSKEPRRARKRPRRAYKFNLKNYDGLIIGEAIKFKHQWPGIIESIQDLIHEGIVLFFEIQKHHKQEKGEFSTFLVDRLKFRYLDLTRFDRTGLKDMSLDIYELEREKGSARDWRIHKQVEGLISQDLPPAVCVSLSKDAQRFLDAAITLPNNVRDLLIAKPRTPYRYAVGTHLKMGRIQVEQIREEITKLLKTSTQT